MPDSNGYKVRAIDASEAADAARFSLVNAGESLPISIQFCLHHCTSIFVYSNSEDRWLGMIVTYVSPLHTRSAAIESIIVAETGDHGNIVSALIDHTLHYYKNNCVFKIEVLASAINFQVQTLLQEHSFKPITTKGETNFCRRILPEKICLHNRQMRPTMNTTNGEVNEDTLFEYFQKDNIVWGTYSGGVVVRGVLLGRMARNGDCDINYLQLNSNNEINMGISHSASEFLNDGRIVLYEDWEWTGNKSGGGRSVIEEIKE